MRKKIIYIKGMHCVACEKLLDDEFKSVARVKGVKVNRKTDSAEINFDGPEPDFGELKKVAKKFNYDVFETKAEFEQQLARPKKIKWSEWLNALSIVVALLLTYKIFKNLGFLDRIDLRSENLTLGIAFLVGLVASVSSCLAVVGSVIIAFGEKYKAEGKGFFAGAVRPNLQFHLGRIGTFFVLGGVLGLLGGELSISGNFVAIFTIIVAVVMGWLGLNILGLVPSIANIGIRMPGKLAKKWDGLKTSEHRAAPFFLGGLTFFLPCGFTQSMQIFALTSGSFFAGALTLSVFALGTMPALLILGVTTTWTRNNKMEVFQKVAGVLVMIFAIYTFQSGLALKGVNADILTTADKQQTAEKSQVSGGQSQPKQEQVVETKLTYDGFEPAVLKIKKGVPVKFVIQGEKVSGCTNRIIIPVFKITKNISYGENVIRFTPTKVGTIDFSCWMGMVRGKFIVE